MNCVTNLVVNSLRDSVFVLSRMVVAQAWKCHRSAIQRHAIEALEPG